jgi:hypothetical protein
LGKNSYLDRHFQHPDEPDADEPDLSSFIVPSKQQQQQHQQQQQQQQETTIKFEPMEVPLV